MSRDLDTPVALWPVDLDEPVPYIPADLAAVDLTDPLTRRCDECGAEIAEPCRPWCTGWPSVVAEVAADDTIDDTQAGRLAILIAHHLRAAKVVGNPTATTTGATNVAVVLTHPSGRDWIVAACEVWDSHPVVYVGQYADDETNSAAYEVEIHGRVAAERAILTMARRRAARHG